jgi:hypothetical protein
MPRVEAVRPQRYEWIGQGIEERIIRDSNRQPALPPAPRKIKVPDMNEIDFDKTPIGDVFGIQTQTLNSETIKAFSQWHPQLFENRYKFRDKSVHIGLEVEAENILKIDPQLTLCFWSVHEDGSLRNRGREFKTYPMPLQYSEAALKLLFNSLNKDVDFSKRTSVHAHIDMRQLSMSQSMGVLYTYAAMENLLFKFAGANRRNSIFCVPLIETDLLFHNNGKPVDMFLQLLKKWQKYTALNLKPLQTFGTMEFRQLPGTDNIQQILIWLDLLTHIRVFAYRYPLKHIITQISELNTSSAYKHFVDDVFDSLSVYLDTSNLQNDMEKACYLIKNSPVANDFNIRVCSSKEKQSSFNEFYNPSEEEFSEQEIKIILILATRFFPHSLSDNITNWNILRKNWTQIWRIANAENRALLNSLKERMFGSNPEEQNEEANF